MFVYFFQPPKIPSKILQFPNPEFASKDLFQLDKFLCVLQCFIGTQKLFSCPFIRCGKGIEPLIVSSENKTNQANSWSGFEQSIAINVNKNWHNICLEAKK